MRFARTSTVLAVFLLLVTGSLRLGAQVPTVHVGYYALFGITIGDYENGERVVLKESEAGKHDNGTFDMLRVDKDSSGTLFAQRLIVDEAGNILDKDKLLICNGTEESTVGHDLATVLAYSLKPTEEGLDVNVIAERKESGAATPRHGPRLFVVNHYRRVATE